MGQESQVWIACVLPWFDRTYRAFGAKESKLGYAHAMRARCGSALASSDIYGVILMFLWPSAVPNGPGETIVDLRLLLQLLLHAAAAAAATATAAPAAAPAAAAAAATSIAAATSTAAVAAAASAAAAAAATAAAAAAAAAASTTTAAAATTSYFFLLQWDATATAAKT